MTRPQTVKVPLDSIIKDERCQQRDLSKDNIDRLVAVLEDGGGFDDPLQVFFEDGEEKGYLAHGFHRHAAYVEHGEHNVEVELFSGTLDDAIDHSCKPVNAGGHLPETMAGKRRRVEQMVRRHPDWTDNRLAEYCGVSPRMVSNARPRADAAGLTSGCEKRNLNTKNPPDKPKTRVGKDGKRYPVKRKTAEDAGVPGVGDNAVDLPAPDQEDNESVDRDSLEAVQGELQELEREMRAFMKRVRKTLDMKGDTIQRPWCSRYSKLTVIAPLNQWCRDLLNDLPVGGTPDKPERKSDGGSK